MSDTVPAAIRQAWTQLLSTPKATPFHYDPHRQRLLIECEDEAWLLQIRVLGQALMGKLNAALDEPAIHTLTGILRPLRVLVTGSRDWEDPQTINDALTETWHDIIQAHGVDQRWLIVHGGCYDGADKFANRWAADNGIETESHPADWIGPCDENCPSGHRRRRTNGKTYCPLAGPLRNQVMVDLGADLVLAFHRDGSRGTGDCVRRAQEAGLPVRTYLS